MFVEKDELMSIELGNIADLGTLATAIVGVIIGLYQYHKLVKVRRSTFVLSLLNQMKDDKGINKIIYQFQYGEFNYSEGFHGNGKYENDTDRTLLLFSYICYLKEKKIITNEEFSFFEISITQALRNDGLIDYLYNLYHFVCKAEGYNPLTDGKVKALYCYLIKFADRRNYIPDDFYDKNAYKTNNRYHCYLTF